MVQVQGFSETLPNYMKYLHKTLILCDSQYPIYKVRIEHSYSLLILEYTYNMISLKLGSTKQLKYIYGTLNSVNIALPF